MNAEPEVQGAPVSEYVKPEGEYAAPMLRFLTRRAIDNHIYDCDGVDSNDRYVLVERSHYDGTLFITSWARTDEAIEYHDGQEYPEDWDVEAIYDLHTGKRYETQGHTTIVSQGEPF